VHALSLIVDVMFAVYLLNFISAFHNSFMSRFSHRAKVWSDIGIGFALLIAVIVLNI
jgi:hypothetical protein